MTRPSLFHLLHRSVLLTGMLLPGCAGHAYPESEPARADEDAAVASPLEAPVAGESREERAFAEAERPAEPAPPPPSSVAPAAPGKGGGGYGVASGMGSGRLAAAPQVRTRREARRGSGPVMKSKTATAVGGGDVEFDTEGYDHIAENDFIAVSDDPRSTFSIDVDTASYSNVRRFLGDGHLPPADAVRIEELINYFSYDYDAPTGDDPFSLASEVARCPWDEDHLLVQVGVQGQRIDQDRVPPRNLVFLLDVSGSMNSPDKLPLLKRGLGLLVDNLRPDDKVSIVVYAGASGMVLQPTSGNHKDQIMDALARLNAGGSTNGGAGIELAYRLAEQSFVRGGINRVVLATDGDFNVGTTSRGGLLRLIEQKRRSGVFLSVLGFGTGNVKDSNMEQIADKGNGNYAYIDSVEEARKVLVEEAGATLVTIAKDVKIQVEFNPAEVRSYRLVGYENRKLAHRDFNDDTKDAGEIGAGHSVTALYEIEPVAGARARSGVDPLKYQDTPGLTPAAASDELMTVKVRYKHPQGDTSKLLSFAVSRTERAVQDASKDFRFAAAVAQFGMLLRDSKYRGEATYDDVLDLARHAIGADPHGHRRAFLGMVQAADALSQGRTPLQQAG